MHTDTRTHTVAHVTAPPDVIRPSRQRSDVTATSPPTTRTTLAALPPVPRGEYTVACQPSSMCATAHTQMRTHTIAHVIAPPDAIRPPRQRDGTKATSSPTARTELAAPPSISHSDCAATSSPSPTLTTAHTETRTHTIAHVTAPPDAAKPPRQHEDTKATSPLTIRTASAPLPPVCHGNGVATPPPSPKHTATDTETRTHARSHAQPDAPASASAPMRNRPRPPVLDVPNRIVIRRRARRLRRLARRLARLNQRAFGRAAPPVRTTRSVGPAASVAPTDPPARSHHYTNRPARPPLWILHTTGALLLAVIRILALWAAWTAGEALHPGPAPKPPTRRHNRRSAYINDVRYRFHNVHGLRDRAFRTYYLRRARETCEILALAETNCSSEAEGTEWGRDWPKSAAQFWVPTPTSAPPSDPTTQPHPAGPSHGNTARGMALLFADSLGDVHATEIWRDPQGRGLAVRACIHQQRTIIVAFHADNKATDIREADGRRTRLSADACQAASFRRLMDAVPFDHTCQYVFMLDANNFVVPRLDYSKWSVHSAPAAPAEARHPEGVRAMHECITRWGGLRDAFRTLHPGAVAYTRRNVISVDQATHEPTAISRSRIDRIYVSTTLATNGAAPKLRSLEHITPNDTDLMAVRRAGSSSKWSDHSAVQATVQYSNVIRPRPRWTVPRHLLAEPAFVNTQLRTLAERTLSAAGDGCARLSALLADSRKAIIAREQKDARANGVKARYLRSCLREAYRQVGSDADSTGTLHTIQDDTPFTRARIALVTWRRQQLEHDLLELQLRKQRRWLRNRGYEEFRTNDVCCRTFFDDARAVQTYSHIDYLLDDRGNKITTMRSIFKKTRAHFGGDGAIFNLHQYTETTPEHRHEIHAKRRRLLDAITADGKTLSAAQQETLADDMVFTPENVQQAIDSLQSNTSPGTDGFTSEFFRTVGQRVVDPETTARIPCPLAHILADTYKECVQKGRMLPCMRTAIVSLIYKNKGKRHDLGKYRPIAVASLVYRIMAKTVVVAMSSVLPAITSDCQKAFKPDEIIGDATRLTQDVIRYCDATGTPGFLVFADQDNAYPRVRWDYLFDVMETMRFPPSFVNIIRTMYNDVHLRFKVNGVTDREHITPQNGLAQGCPLSPCLYLLCIQGLISLMHTDSLQPDGIRGIPIPGRTSLAPSTVLTSAFADDVCIFLESARQLTRFKALLEVYCDGAGALNSWEKTVGLRVGGEQESDNLPEGWTEGVDISTNPTLRVGERTVSGIIRYLGIFLGAPAAVSEAWLARTCERISERAIQWRTKRMPHTRDGRAIALRNSILAQAWYLVENQVPPNLADMLQQWRSDEWLFFANQPPAPPLCLTRAPPDTNRDPATAPSTTDPPTAATPHTAAGGYARDPGPPRSTGSTNVRQLTLIQDHVEGGKRVPDVETFVASLHIRRIRHMLEPNTGPHTNFLLYWIDQYYGHLRQGLRLLTSHCDFLRFDDAPADSKHAPSLWRLTLKAAGSMRGLAPATPQTEATPHAHYPHGLRNASITGEPRTVNIKPVWSVGEAAMEPLFYNPNMSGWWGAPLADPADWEIDDRERHSKAAVLRWSDNKEQRSREMYTATKAMAAWGLTHFIHLLEGTEPKGELRIASYRDIRGRHRGTPLFTALEYQSLVDAVPHAWKQLITATAELKRQHPTWSFRDAVDSTPLPPGSWIQTHDGRIGRIEANGPQALHAFSGKNGRADGLAACLSARGVKCTEIDTLIDATKHDLLADDVYHRILNAARNGQYSFGCFGVPCSTFSVVRMDEDTDTGGAVVVRDRYNILGLPGLPPHLQRQVDRSNQLVDRAVTIARAIVEHGGDVCFENPCDRGGQDDEDSVVRSLYQKEWGAHGPLWRMPAMINMKRDLNLHAVSFPQCALGGRFQKYTTLWFTARLAPVLNTLNACTCTHDKHAEVAKGMNQARKWRSAEAAAYPAQMNTTLADAAIEAAREQHLRNHAPIVNTWYTLNHRSQLIGRDGRTITPQSQLEPHHQVHVWTQEALAHSKEEQEWRERHPDDKPPAVMWCGGRVLDWDVLECRHGHSNSAANLGDWAWSFHTTDRARPPVSLASADVFHIYNLRLSYLHYPPRTFDLEHVHEQPNMSGTTWVDLLSPTTADATRSTDDKVSRILAARARPDGTAEYLVRWYGCSTRDDTWVTRRQVARTAAFDRFCHRSHTSHVDASVARQWLRKKDNNPSDDSGTPQPDIARTIRLGIFRNLRRSDARRTATDSLYSVLLDAEPIGNGRCRRKLLPTTCSICRLLRGDERTQTTRHAHLECPDTAFLLSCLQRIAIELTGTNQKDVVRLRNCTAREIVNEHRLPLITGYRFTHDLRTSVDSPIDDLPYIALIAEAHHAIQQRRRSNDAILERNEQPDRHTRTDPQSLYTVIRAAMQEHAHHAKRMAQDDEDRLYVLHPDKRFDENGPVVEWNKAWVCSGWSDARGNIRMPRRLMDVEHMGAVKCASPWAWHIPTWLHTFLRWRSGFSLAQRALIATPPRAMLATPNDLICYCDGAYDPANEGGSQKGGFGFVAVTGGDGDADAHAHEVMRAWGPVTTCAHAPTWIGATEHTNNTAELTALVELLRWLTNAAPHPRHRILIRPDSEYAMGVALGDNSPSVNTQLARVARALYQRLCDSRSGNVGWAHVKAHSGHKWNDIVDELATKGSRCEPGQACVPGRSWAIARYDGRLWEAWQGGDTTWATDGELRITIRHDTDRSVGPSIQVDMRQSTPPVRVTLTPTRNPFPADPAVNLDMQHSAPLTWAVPAGSAPSSVACLYGVDVSEITRVLRCTDPFGVLNLHLDRTLSNKDVAITRDATHQLLCTAREQRLSDYKRFAQAADMVTAAGTHLRNKTMRDSTIRTLETAEPDSTSSGTCPIDLRSLRSFISSPEGNRQRHNDDGTPKGQTHAQAATHLLDSIARALQRDITQEDEVWLPIEWRLGQGTAARLFASGHIIAAREFAKGADPFKGYGRLVRWEALSRFGSDCDDVACFPNAAVHLIRVHRENALRYVRHKDTILPALARQWWPHLPHHLPEGRERAKAFINRLNNQGSVFGLFRQFNILSGHTPSALAPNPHYPNIRLPGDAGRFDMRTYCEQQVERTQWLADHRPRMLQLLHRIDDSRPRPLATLRSYCQEEVEGICRRAKQRWAEWEGHQWINLQHDGTVIGLAGSPHAREVEQALSRAASTALGFDQTVEIKHMPTHHPTQPWTWVPRPKPRWVPLTPSPAATSAMASLTSAIQARTDTTVTVDCFLIAHDVSNFDSEWTTACKHSPHAGGGACCDCEENANHLPAHDDTAPPMRDAQPFLWTLEQLIASGHAPWGYDITAAMAMARTQPAEAAIHDALTPPPHPCEVAHAHPHPTLHAVHRATDNPAATAPHSTRPPPPIPPNINPPLLTAHQRRPPLPPPTTSQRPPPPTHTPLPKRKTHHPRPQTWTLMTTPTTCRARPLSTHPATCCNHTTPANPSTPPTRHHHPTAHLPLTFSTPPSPWQNRHVAPASNAVHPY